MKNKTVQVSDNETKVVRIPEPGDLVIYHNPHTVPHQALVVTCHGGEHWGYGYSPCINLVHVSSDVNKTDGYGRQLERQSSCCHRDVPGMAHGNYYRFPDEEPIARPVV